jgi:hypothetical protein
MYKKIFLTLQIIEFAGRVFYILLARINARIQALLRHGCGIRSENEKVKKEN